MLKSPMSTESTETCPSRARFGGRSHIPCWLIDDRAHSVARVVDVPADQLELGVEVVLDAGERLEPVPGHPPHLVQCVGVAAGRRPRRCRLQRIVRWAGPTWRTRPASATAPPVPAARSAVVRRSAAGGVDRGNHVVGGERASRRRGRLTTRGRRCGGVNRSAGGGSRWSAAARTKRTPSATRWRYQWSNHASVVGPFSTPSALPSDRLVWQLAAAGRW